MAKVIFWLDFWKIFLNWLLHPYMDTFSPFNRCPVYRLLTFKTGKKSRHIFRGYFRHLVRKFSRIFFFAIWHLSRSQILICSSLNSEYLGYVPDELFTRKYLALKFFHMSHIIWLIWYDILKPKSSNYTFSLFSINF